MHSGRHIAIHFQYINRAQMFSGQPFSLWTCAYLTSLLRDNTGRIFHRCSYLSSWNSMCFQIISLSWEENRWKFGSWSYQRQFVAGRKIVELISVIGMLLYSLLVLMSGQSSSLHNTPFQFLGNEQDPYTDGPKALSTRNEHFRYAAYFASTSVCFCYQLVCVVSHK